MSIAYFVVLPDAPLGEVVLEPLLAGAVVLPDVLLWPEVLPEVAPLAASFMHFSFSAPIRCAHLVSLAPAAALPLAPVLVEVLDWPLVLPLAEDEEGVVVWELVLPLADGVVVVCELVLLLPPAAAEPLVEVDGVCALVLPLAEDDGVLCELVLPLAAPRSRRQRSFSAAIMLSQLLAAMPPAAALPDDAPLVCAPVLPDEVWANEALDSARSAAAVALARSFRFIWMLLSRIGWSECSASHANSVPVHPAAPCAEGASTRGSLDRLRTGLDDSAGSAQGADSAVAQIDFSAKRYFDVPELELPLWLGGVLAPLLAGLELDGLVVCELVLPLPEVLELDGVWELVLPLAPPEVPCAAK